MRILMWGMLGRGGHARYCRALSQALQSEGAEVMLRGTHVYPEPWYTRWRVPRMVDRTIRHSYHVATLLRAVDAFEPDVVHMQQTAPILDAWWLPHLSRRVPVVLTVHNVQPHRAALLNHPRFENAVLRSGQALCVHSETNRQALEARLPSARGRVFVVRHGVWEPEVVITREAARARLGLPMNRPVVLFFGALRRNKGLPLLVESMAVLRRDAGARSPLLLVAGRPDADEPFEPIAARMEELGLRDDVVAHVGFVADHDVSAYYAAANVVALPYDLGFQAQSGVLLEAYGYESPVVVTRAGALGETVTEDGTGLVVEQRTPEEFAQALSRALYDAELREGALARMRELRKTKYSWARSAQGTLAVYRSVQVRQ